MTKGAGDGHDRTSDVTQPLEPQDLGLPSIDVAHGTPHEMRHERTKGSTRPRVSTSTSTERRLTTCVHLGVRTGVESTCDGREMCGHLQSFGLAADPRGHDHRRAFCDCEGGCAAIVHKGTRAIYGSRRACCGGAGRCAERVLLGAATPMAKFHDT